MRTVLVVLALASAGACKKKAPEQAQPEIASRIDSDLAVVMVTPSSIPGNSPTAVQLVGNGFARGAEVKIGDQWVSPVEWQSESTLGLTTPALADGAYDVTVQNPDAQWATLWSGLIVGSGGGVSARRSGCNRLVLYFQTDSDDLEPEASRMLKDQLQCYLDWTGRIRLEGHADERGTTDYNVALGERRAASVRHWLSRGGLPLHKMGMVSYGEEQPADPSHDEAAWSKNRRVVVEPEE